MAKGSKRNQERKAAQENKARRVAKRNDPAPKAAAPATPKAAAPATPKAAAPATPKATTQATPKTENKKDPIKKARRQRNRKREENEKIRENNQATNQAIKSDNQAARDQKFTIDGREFGNRAPGKISEQTSFARSDSSSLTKSQAAATNTYKSDPYKELYSYSEGIVKDAARNLGIRNVNSKKEVNQILGQIRNPQSVNVQLQAPDKEKKRNRSGKNNNQQSPAPAPPSPPVPSGPDPLQVMQDNFQSQLADLMSSMADYDQRFIEQRNNYEQDIFDMRNTLSAQMNPQMRNPIFGVRTPGLMGQARNMSSSFGRTGSRLGGIRNNTLNLS